MIQVNHSCQRINGLFSLFINYISGTYMRESRFFNVQIFIDVCYPQTAYLVTTQGTG